MMDLIVDTSKVSLYISLGTIALNPIAWNIVARDGEFLQKGLPRLCLLHLTNTYAHRVQEQNTNALVWRECTSWMLFSRVVHIHGGHCEGSYVCYVILALSHC